MNGPQHYAVAENLLSSVTPSNTLAETQTIADLAQAHATLALVAAQIDAAELHTVEINDASNMTEWGEVTR